MRVIGFYVAGIHLLPVKFIIYLRFINKAAVTQKVFRLVLIELHIPLVVKTVLAPEIGDPALGGYARTSKENNLLALVDHVPEFFDLAHCNPSYPSLCFLSFFFRRYSVS